MLMFVNMVLEQYELAATYVDDGAFRSAARCLKEAATFLEKHADNCDASLQASGFQALDLLGIAS